jgi:hypothetical protein
MKSANFETMCGIIKHLRKIFYRGVTSLVTSVQMHYLHRLKEKQYVCFYIPTTV